jgi:hypothetical protein
VAMEAAGELVAGAYENCRNLSNGFAQK